MMKSISPLATTNLRQYLFTVLFCMPWLFTAAQFAVVKDADGFCNVRFAADINARVTDTLKNGTFVYCFEKTGNWVNLDYTKNNEERRGYLYHDRLALVNNYEEIPLLGSAANSIRFGKDSVGVIVIQQKFNKGKHRFSYFKDAEGQLELIDGYPIWGTDGGMPHTEYKSITVNLGQKRIVLPPTALRSLYEPRLADTQVHYDRANNTVYIQSSNSDGAGYYQVIWKIENGAYKERFIAYGF